MKITTSKSSFKYIRFDPFNQSYQNADTSVDIEFIGMDSDLNKICSLVSADFETITLYENGIPCDVDTATGAKVVPTYVHPDSEYTEAEDIQYFARIDNVSGAAPIATSCSADGHISILKNRHTNHKNQITFAGWCVVEGGVDKYVWSVDGGKTWNDFIGNDTLAVALDAAIYKYVLYYPQLRLYRRRRGLRSSVLADQLSQPA